MLTQTGVGTRLTGIHIRVIVFFRENLENNKPWTLEGENLSTKPC